MTMTIEKIPNEVVIKKEDVLFRVWVYRSEGKWCGVVDLMRKSNNLYIDAMEADIGSDEFGIIRLDDRGRGKDIPSDWLPIIETKLLTPISTKSIKPYKEHLFGSANISRIANLKFKYSEYKLLDLKIISPLEYNRLGGNMLGEDLPSSYNFKLPKVFLCHSSMDKAHVRRIAKEFRDNNIDIWLDEEDILVGEKFITRIQEGITEANFVAIILTPNFVSGLWATEELQMALEKDISSGNTIVLPILIEDCTIPPMLRIRSYADLRSDNYKVGLRQLIESVHSLFKRRD